MEKEIRTGSRRASLQLSQNLKEVRKRDLQRSGEEPFRHREDTASAKVLR